MKAYSEMTLKEQEEYCNGLRADIELADALKRLIANEDFNKVFTEHYIKEEPARLTSLFADPNFTASSDKKNVLYERLLGIAHFSNFVRETLAMGYKSSMELEMAIHPEKFKVEEDE